MLYVVDSVTRGWVEQAKKAGQTLGQSSSTPGTYAAGVGLVTELLPSFMNDMINNAPEEQKVRYLEASYKSKDWPASRSQEIGRSLGSLAPLNQEPRNVVFWMFAYLAYQMLI